MRLIGSYLPKELVYNIELTRSEIQSLRAALQNVKHSTIEGRTERQESLLHFFDETCIK